MHIMSLTAEERGGGDGAFQSESRKPRRGIGKSLTDAPGKLGVGLEDRRFGEIHALRVAQHGDGFLERGSGRGDVRLGVVGIAQRRAEADEMAVGERRRGGSTGGEPVAEFGGDEVDLLLPRGNGGIRVEKEGFFGDVSEIGNEVMVDFDRETHGFPAKLVGNHKRTVLSDCKSGDR